MPDPYLLSRPDFDRPPVVETVLSVQFEPLGVMRAVHFGLLWRKLKNSFPKTEERPALDPAIERFPEPTPKGVRMQFEVVEIPPLPRLWLLNAAGTEMIQVQNDRFIKNWRKTGETDAYPRYELVIKPAFERDLELFRAFVAEEGLGVLKVNQCEVTYVNHIVSGDGWERSDEIEKIFTFWKQPPATPVPGRAEDFGFHARFPIHDDLGHPIGRLHVEVQPSRRKSDSRPMYVLNLTARGICGQWIEFLDIGHLWIVNSFRNITTDHMHTIWGER